MIYGTMLDTVCPDCERIVEYDDYNKAYECAYCGWRKAINDTEINRLRMEIATLRRDLYLEKEKQINIGDERYCVFIGDQREPAGVHHCELTKMVLTPKRNTYFFRNISGDYPENIIYRSQALFEMRTSKYYEDLQAWVSKEINKNELKNRRLTRINVGAIVERNKFLDFGDEEEVAAMLQMEEDAQTDVDEIELYDERFVLSKAWNGVWSYKLLPLIMMKDRHFFTFHDKECDRNFTFPDFTFGIKIFIREDDAIKGVNKLVEKEKAKEDRLNATT